MAGGARRLGMCSRGGEEACVSCFACILVPCRGICGGGRGEALEQGGWRRRRGHVLVCIGGVSQGEQHNRDGEETSRAVVPILPIEETTNDGHTVLLDDDDKKFAKSCLTEGFNHMCGGDGKERWKETGTVRAKAKAGSRRWGQVI